MSTKLLRRANQNRNQPILAKALGDLKEPIDHDDGDKDTFGLDMPRVPRLFDPENKHTSKSTTSN
jgi:hypothetical protein